MLTDAFHDFTFLAKEPGADLPSLLATLEDKLEHYSHKDFRYFRQIFPLLRKAARWHVAGKLSRRALHAVSLRLNICYFGQDGETEQELVEDLRAYVRSKPTIDLRTKVGRICRSRQAAYKATKPKVTSTEATEIFIPPTARMTVTGTGVILRLARQ